MTPRWIATASDHFAGTDAVIVEADDLDAAATEALEILDEERQGRGDPDPVSHVFVAQWDDRVAFVPRPAVERAELQCCGGPAKDYHGAGGHWATCPERPPGTGQPRADDEEQTREIVVAATCPCGEPVGGHACTPERPCGYARGMAADRWRTAGVEG